MSNFRSEKMSTDQRITLRTGRKKGCKALFDSLYLLRGQTHPCLDTLVISIMKASLSERGGLDKTHEKNMTGGPPRRISEGGTQRGDFLSLGEF